MPKTFQKILILNKMRCHVRKLNSGKNSFTYEIRFRQNGYSITACGKTIQLAKTNFLEKAKTAKPIKKENPMDFPFTFQAFTEYYYAKFRKPKISELTYEKDYNRLKKHLFPFFKETPIKKISPLHCQNFLDGLIEKGMGKTAEECYSLLSVIFKGAIAHKIISDNPLDIVVHVKHVGQSGSALSRDEEKKFIQAIKGSKYEVAFALALYTGLRPNELTKANVNGEFIVTINSKRKSRKIEYKKIPICNKLRPYIDRFDELEGIKQSNVSIMFPTYCKGHKLYDLRTTFNTRCKELGVSDHARMHFMGHSLGALGNAYTDLSDEYLLSEGKKLDEW